LAQSFAPFRFLARPNRGEPACEASKEANDLATRRNGTTSPAVKETVEVRSRIELSRTGDASLAFGCAILARD
jgi:hypothetical protein